MRLSGLGYGGQWITGYYAAQNPAEPISAIPWKLYTHVIHFAAAPNSDGSVALHYLTPSEIAAFVQGAHQAGKYALTCLKDNDGDLGAFANATSPGSIAGFVANIAAFVTGYGYDGVDLDWEQNIAVSQYVDLLSRLRGAMPGKVITMAAGNWGGLEQVAAASVRSVDQINLMCYDMDSPGSGYSWHNSALLQAGDSSVTTCDWRAWAFTGAGVPAGKLGIGIPFYGRRWPGTTQPLTPGNFSPSTFGYRDLASDPQRWQAANQQYDSKYKANYLSIPALNEFDSYTGTEFLNDLAAWARSQGFGGFMAFPLDDEYMPGSDTPYPLSSALYAAVNGGSAMDPPVYVDQIQTPIIQQPSPVSFLGPPIPAPQPMPAIQVIPPALQPIAEQMAAMSQPAPAFSMTPAMWLAAGALALWVLTD